MLFGMKPIKILSKKIKLLMLNIILWDQFLWYRNLEKLIIYIKINFNLMQFHLEDHIFRLQHIFRNFHEKYIEVFEAIYVI